MEFIGHGDIPACYVSLPEGTSVGLIHLRWFGISASRIVALPSSYLYQNSLNRAEEQEIYR